MTLQRAFDFGAFDSGSSAPAAPARRNLVIEAGAGTGKTTAIVAEVLKLVLEHEQLVPERIVLMTFTEKAAGEIAERIRVALEDLDAHLDDEVVAWPLKSPNPLVVITDRDLARRRIGRHLGNIDALRSQTIHSFCQSLLRQFPIEAGLDPQFRIIEGFERSLLYGQLYDAWVDAETRVDPAPAIVEEWELVFAHLGYLFAIRDLVFALLDRRDLLGETGYDFGDFELVRATLEDAVTWVRRGSTEGVKDPAARAVAEYLLENSDRPDSLDAWLRFLQPIAARMRDIDYRGCGPLKEPMTALRSGEKGDSIYDRLASHRASEALLAMTRRFIEYLDAEKRKLGVVDFDDLLLRTMLVLEDDAVLTRARAQFDFIFVDEFQDTDRTQARIIDRLARDAGNALIPGRTIVVGDPKQSIYGFRRADPETYDRMTKNLRAAGAEKRDLLDQYRSDAPLLDAINALFECLFPEAEPDPNVFRPAYKALTAGRSTSRRELDARITLLQTDADDKADRYFAEAETIAEWILTHREGGDRDLQRFAILFRRLTKLDDYLDTFDRYGIDYVLPPTRLFLDRRAPVDLLAVLRAIGYPFDRGAQISAARTPYFALTDDEIATGIIEENESWQAFVRAIEGYRNASRHLTVSQLIDHIVDGSGIERVYDAAIDGVRHKRHLEHLRAIAFDYDQATGGSVRQFVDEITRRRSEPDEMEPILIDESRNAVRILSVHAAKGLQFETVILPDLAFASNTSADAVQLFTVEEPRSLVLAGRAESLSANFRFLGPDKPLRKVASQREDAEMRRLFYVAVTRAMTDVVFVANPKHARNVGFWKCITETFGKNLGELWPAEGRVVNMLTVGANVVPVAFETVATKAAAALTQSETGRVRLHDQKLETTLAASPIVPLDLPMPDEVAIALTPQKITAGRSAARRKQAGILLHRFLELWDLSSDPEPILQRLVAESDADAIAGVRQRLEVIRRSPTLARIANAETIGRELVLHYVDDSGSVVERRVDRLLRENGRDLVVDYKTGPYTPARFTGDQEQVARYCAAVAAMTERPCAGLVWYVDADVVRDVVAD
ncbi:MAG TPA: UvrD-helicase domain-containing protein [Thermoanaerobaculia bacterium]|jgi:ATP-dependent helicase/nuclease subunit A